MTSGLIFCLFALDVTAGFPFSRISLAVDFIGMAICIIISYLVYDAYKDLR